MPLGKTCCQPGRGLEKKCWKVPEVFGVTKLVPTLRHVPASLPVPQPPAYAGERRDALCPQLLRPAGVQAGLPSPSRGTSCLQPLCAFDPGALGAGLEPARSESHPGRGDPGSVSSWDFIPNKVVLGVSTALGLPIPHPWHPPAHAPTGSISG